VGCGPRCGPATRSGWVPVGLHLGGHLSQMADPDLNDSDLLQRAKPAQAQSKALREQVARSAEAVAETEQEVARVPRKLADQGGPLAAEAGSMPTGLRIWRRRGEPRLSACAGLNRAEDRSAWRFRLRKLDL
jgi:hypothetical protein